MKRGPALITAIFAHTVLLTSCREPDPPTISVASGERSLAREAKGDAYRVISMSLYGSNTDYIYGAIENALIVRRDWSNWTLWIYHDDAIDNTHLRVLRNLGAVLWSRPYSPSIGHAGMFWRFEVTRHSKVTRFFIRDTDARLTPRDKTAVDEWVASKQLFHVVRDHPKHAWPIMGGMWGSVGGFVSPVLLDYRRARAVTDDDQDDLARLVWPHVRQHALVHDSFFCGAPHLRGVEWRPFPRQRVSAMDFVGNKYDASNAFEGMRLNDTCPQGCRKKMEWRFC